MRQRTLDRIGAQCGDDVLVCFTQDEVDELLAEIDGRLRLLEEAELAAMPVLGTA
jgi:tRNA threonylcarbamoyladenosine modification (KEOPS) complex Cgi121 subunit